MIQFSFQQQADDGRKLTVKNLNTEIYSQIARYLSAPVVLGSFFVLLLSYASGKGFLMLMSLGILLISSYILTFKENHRNALIIVNVMLTVFGLLKMLSLTMK